MHSLFGDLLHAFFQAKIESSDENMLESKEEKVTCIMQQVMLPPLIWLQGTQLETNFFNVQS